MSQRKKKEKKVSGGNVGKLKGKRPPPTPRPSFDSVWRKETGNPTPTPTPTSTSTPF